MKITFFTKVEEFYLALPLAINYYRGKDSSQITFVLLWGWVRIYFREKKNET